jgi:hypothetical protein
VLQELSPGRRNSFSFIDGNVSGRELFITTRKPPVKRRPRKKAENGETPKRGRPRKRDSTAQPAEEPATPAAQTTDNPATPQTVATEDVEVLEVEALDHPEKPDESQVDADQGTELEETRRASGFEEDAGIEDEGGFGESQYDLDLETPTRNFRVPDSPLPVEPYTRRFSFHSSPPSSPVYEEYQVPIPTSSSPVRSSDPRTPRTATPRSPLDSQKVYRRRTARSRSASRERRMSIAPVPQSQGLPTTPRRSASEESETLERGSVSSQSTQARSPGILPPLSATSSLQPTYSEGMTPVRNWAARVAEGAFQFDTSPGKLAQLRIASRITTPMVEYEDDDDDDDEEEAFLPPEDDTTQRSIYSTQDTSSLHLRSLPQITRLRESPIVITSSPPLEPKPVHYQWKTVSNPDLEDHMSDLNLSDEEPALPEPPVYLIDDDDDDKEQISERSRSQSQYSRQSSPARSILTDMGDDVISISSVNQRAAQRAAQHLLRSPYYSKVTFDDERGQKVWEQATASAGDYALSPIDDDSQLEDLLDYPVESEELEAEELEREEDGEDEEEQEQQNILSELANTVRAPPRISQGDWTKVDWKRMEKCLDLMDGDTTEAVTLFLERYVGREREEVEMRCRAVLLAKRRRILEGKKVGFILSTHE